jgi:C4-dicarboxylate transporter DctM subunit
MTVGIEKNDIPVAKSFFSKAGVIIDKVNLSAAFLSGTCLISIAILVTYEVCARYLFNAPTTWVLEVSIYLCLASVFLSGGYVLQQDNHICVDLVTGALPQRTRARLGLITSLAAFIYCFVLFWKGGGVAINSFRSSEVSPTLLRMPMYITRGLVSLGGLLLCLQYLKTFGAFWTEMKNTPVTDSQREAPLIVRCVPVIFVVLLVGSSALFLFEGFSWVGIILLLFILLFSGLPVAFAMGFLGLIGFYFLFGGNSSLVQMPLIAYKNLDDFVIVSVPLFMMASIILMIGKIGSDLFEVASTWTRHLPGGLEVSAVFACAIFAAISGSSAATVATIGTVAIPVMFAHGCKRERTYGAIAIGGVLGPIIPPSLHMILIGAITGDSVGKLFMAGMLPGVMLALIFAGYFFMKAVMDPRAQRQAKATWKERSAALKKSVFGLLTPVIILGGIYTGIFTATEAAAVSSIYALLICMVLYRTIRWGELKDIIIKSAETSGMVLFIIIGAMTFGQLVSILQIPDKVVDYLQVLPFPPMVILGIGLVFILVLGALMDEASILLITYPIFYQVFVTHYQWDPIWFAMVFVFTLEVGLVAPPVGLNLFVVQGIDRTAQFKEVVKGVMPLVLLMIVGIIIVILIKPLSTWLPSTIG